LAQGLQGPPRGAGAEEKIKTKRRTNQPTFFGRFLRFSGLILENILMAFLGSSCMSCRETVKNAIKKIDGKIRQENSFFSLNFFGQKFLTWTYPKGFLGVFELPLLRNAEKHHKNFRSQN
jgi:hypothetical protein